MEDNKNYERSEHLENITDASMKDDDYFNASRNIDRKYITIEGARENNLKNINVKIPREKFVVVTGLSGSGKSSLAFDTIYAEGQRRYMESLSSYARQFLGQAEKPDVDKIEGLSPAISIDQKSTNRNPRSTVGTVTEIYDYFRLLYARVGIPHCPNCGKVISRQTVDQMVDEIIEILHADVIILVEETFFLDTGHIKDIQLRENIFHFNNFLKWNIVCAQHIITDVIRETKLLRGD